MATNLAKLKGKGVPPPIEASLDPIKDNTRRRDSGEIRPLQVRISVDVFEEFSEMAGREFGFSHGAKKQLFLKMWEVYKAQKA